MIVVKDLLELFSPSAEQIAYLISKYPVLQSTDNICSLHIRRGPDICSIYSEHHLKQIENYTFELLDYMIEKKNITNIFVLTNDRAYCNAILDGNSRYITKNLTITHNTCTSITIAEGLKEYINSMGNKIVVLVKNKNIQMNFINEIYSKCTGEEYIQDDKRDDKYERNNNNSSINIWIFIWTIRKTR